MNKIYPLAILIMFVSALNVFSQKTETLDTITYTPPSGWEKEAEKELVVYSKVNMETGSYCVIMLIAPLPASNDSKENFNSAWSTLVTESATSSDQPTIGESASAQGWILESGFGSYESDGIKGVAMLFTFTGDGKMVNVLIKVNSEEFEDEITAYIESLDLPEISEKAVAPKAPVKEPEPAKAKSGITTTTTNFDDGWVSTPLDDYVRVTKNGTEVRLYYPNAQVDQRRPQNTNTFEPHYWDAFVKPTFNAGQVLVREKEQYSYGQNDNWEAAATDRQTGKSRYVGMGLVFNNGSCWTIVVSAPDKNTYYSLFPNDPSFKTMLAYNKFAVVQQDLIGKWNSFDSASIGYYSIYSGDYAGTATASTNDSFVFNSNGTYQSEHSGTSTFRGSLAHGKSTYNGTFSVNIWNLNASNRGANDPGEFFCEFQAVKGGFMLKLVNKTFTGMTMSLFKTR